MTIDTTNTSSTGVSEEKIESANVANTAMTPETGSEACAENVANAVANEGANEAANASEGEKHPGRVSHASDEVVVRIEGLKKSFGGTEVLRDVNLQVHRGEVVVVLGPSGSGKSTMLRCINLLETPTAGKIFFEDTEITARGTDINKIRAQVGMVFQSFKPVSTLDGQVERHACSAQSFETVERGSRSHCFGTFSRSGLGRPRGL